MGTPFEKQVDNEALCEEREQESIHTLERVIEPLIADENLTAEEKTQQIVGVFRVSRSFSGPIPPPDLLDGYQKHIPDAAERILRMAESEQRHREMAEKEMLAQNRCNIEGGISANKRSQIFAFILVVVLISVGTLLTIFEYIAVGGIIFGTTIIAIASVFITGKTKQNRDKNPNE